MDDLIADLIEGKVALYMDETPEFWEVIKKLEEDGWKAAANTGDKLANVTRLFISLEYKLLCFLTKDAIVYFEDENERYLPHGIKFVSAADFIDDCVDRFLDVLAGDAL